MLCKLGSEPSLKNACDIVRHDQFMQPSLETEQVALDTIITWTSKLCRQTSLVCYSTENRSKLARSRCLSHALICRVTLTLFHLRGLKQGRTTDGCRIKHYLGKLGVKLIGCPAKFHHIFTILRNKTSLVLHALRAYVWECIFEDIVSVSNLTNLRKARCVYISYISQILDFFNHE